MGGGISKSTTQAFIGGTGIFQLVLYAIFLVTPADNMLTKAGWTSIAIIASLAISLGFALTAANVNINDCEGQNCNQLPKQIIMNICPIIATFSIALMMYTEVEMNKIFFFAFLFGLLIMTTFYILYTVDFRGVLCLCDADSCSINKCKKDLPQCTIDCLS
jgi:hypothetical protein